MKKINEKLLAYMRHIEFETLHRKKWLARAVKNKRYIRGTINGKIKETIHSRDTGHRTTDPLIRSAVLAKTGGKCYLCWRQWNPAMADRLPHLFFKHLQIDHIVPFSKFGPNAISNYMPVCSKCNNKKSDLSLAEYRAGMRRPRWRKK